jgi:CheY-like chemotaxis protein
MQSDQEENAKRQPVILFADDDPVCLEVGIQMLQKLGYKVLDAKDGKEAVSTLKEYKTEVDLVILDMRMPHNGGSTFNQIKKINSEVKVLIASGYSEEQGIREVLTKGCNGFIQKPFGINVLSRIITSALND